MDPFRGRIAAAAVAMLLAAAAPAYAVVPSLTPVIVALVPQLLLLLATAFLVLVRPRTWLRAAAWAVRHPLPALCGLAVAGGLGWGGTWLFSGGGASAAAAAWEPPKPACGYEGQRGGPGHTYASDSRGADPVGPNLEPDVRRIAKDVSVRAVSSDGPRVFTVSSRAGAGGTTLAAWSVADGQRAWSVDVPGEVAGPPLVPADGSRRVMVLPLGAAGEMRLYDAERGGGGSVIKLDKYPSAEVAFRFDHLVVPSFRGILYHLVRDLKAAHANGGIPDRRQWSAPEYGSVYEYDKSWTMLVLDEQARAFVGNGRDLVCMDLLAGGRRIWRRSLGGVTGHPAWSAGWLYVAHAPGGDAAPEVVCIDPETPDGAVAWRLPLSGLALEALLAVGKARLVVPVASAAGSALAVVDTRRRAVMHLVPLDAPPAQPLVLADAGDGAAYVLDKKNRVSRVALKTGRVSWTVDLGVTANGPMILADGVLLVPTDRGVAVLE